MKLIEKIDQHRRDFTGKYQCEKCDAEETRKGCYDDAYFHNSVTPDWKCKTCGESTNSLGAVKAEVRTKYAEHEVI